MLRFKISLASALALAGISVVCDVRDARACGGCFSPPPPPTQVDTSVVTDHRMAFSISPAQTVLWDQIRYSGNPSDFAWVLPVKQGARLELSQDAWIAALDASTQVVIQGPTPNCPPPPNQGGGCAFGGESSASGAAFAAGGATNVQVVSQSVVGPYDAVTVRSTQGQALGDWLRANGYDVPVAIQPTIDAYTAGGFDFIALKLRPGVGVQAMQPVRVVTQGADPSLPLRMVAAGIGPNVGILLFVLSEGRYHPQNFPDASIDFTQLKWDGAQGVSNYETLASAAMAANGGTSWLTESAAPVDLGYSYGNGYNPSLPSAYQGVCSPLTLPPPPNCGVVEAGVVEAGEAQADAEAPDAESEAGDDASSVQDAAVDSGEAAATLADGAAGAACSSTTVLCDDYTLAMNTVAAGTLWVTRLRAFLPASALATDLVLEASPSQVEVPSFHATSTYTDPSYAPSCPNYGNNQSCACRTAASPRSPLADAFVLGIGVAVVGSWLRRRRR
jgi:hypothetical protein